VLADPEFGQPGSIDLLLGAEVYSRLIRPGVIKLGDDKPTLQETALGWIVFGAVRRRVPEVMAGNVMTITREIPLPALEKFGKLDTFNTEVAAMTVQERLCEEHFLSKGLPGQQKLHILQSSLRGEARNVLTDTAFSQGGYDDTWLRLKARYQNGKILVLAAIATIVDYKPIDGSSRQLRALHDTIKNSMSSLKNL